MPSSTRMEQLGAALRSAAARAAECAGGGCALIFARLPGDEGSDVATRLRAAAGFGAPDAARAAAEALVPRVREALREGKPLRSAGHVALGERGAGGISILPLVCESRTLGALVVGSPTPVAAEGAAAHHLSQLAEATALRLDHAHLRWEIDRLRSSLGEQRELVESESESGDELLRLSEALFAQDIELLRHNEKLGKIEKLKNDFIEKMSRELRTPLNSIIEAIITVLAGENEKISDGSKASLRRALDEGTAFQRTLQNILDLWRIKQGELPLELQEVNLVEVVEEAIFSVQDTLGEKPVRIEKVFERPLPKVKTDLAKVNQVVFMLLDNAVKFTHDGSIRIAASVADGVLECEVRDTGIGICPDDQQFIFDEFFQVDDHASTRYRGAGLGLALVRDLLVLLEGEIAVQSEAGKGTCVRVRVPVQVL